MVVLCRHIVLTYNANPPQSFVEMTIQFQRLSNMYINYIREYLPIHLQFRQLKEHCACVVNSSDNVLNDSSKKLVFLHEILNRSAFECKLWALATRATKCK